MCVIDAPGGGPMGMGGNATPTRAGAAARGNDHSGGGIPGRCAQAEPYLVPGAVWVVAVWGLVWCCDAHHNDIHTTHTSYLHALTTHASASVTDQGAVAASSPQRLIKTSTGLTRVVGCAQKRTHVSLHQSVTRSAMPRSSSFSRRSRRHRGRPAPT